MLILIIIVMLVLSFCLAALWPGRSRTGGMQVFIRYPIAHRGLHDNRGAFPENSMAAYENAVRRGYGIELDVRKSADGELICMHDRSLLRACGVDRLSDELTWDELRRLKLFSSDEGIPLFRDVLAAVDGKVPIVMEIKGESAKMAKSVSEHAAKLLDHYNGPVCMESFHPSALLWFKLHRPGIMRGQLSEKFQGYSFPHSTGAFVLSWCVLNFLTKPDFIAYNVTQQSLLRFRLQHGFAPTVWAGWTVKSEEEMRAASAAFDIIIFEGFEPRCETDEDKEVFQDAAAANNSLFGSK